jgi:hypothetical protein
MHTLLIFVPCYSIFSDTAASLTPDTHGASQCDDNAARTNTIETNK